MILIVASIVWYLYLGFLTALVITTCDITIGHNDVDDILNVKDGKDYLEAMLLWPVIVFVGLLVGMFKSIKLLSKFIHWSSKPLLKLMDSFVLTLKGK
jgi:hypothetical protein